MSFWISHIFFQKNAALITTIAMKIKKAKEKTISNSDIEKD